MRNPAFSAGGQVVREAAFHGQQVGDRLSGAGNRVSASIRSSRSAIARNRGMADAGTGEPGTGLLETVLVDRTLPQPASISPASAVRPAPVPRRALHPRL